MGFYAHPTALISPGDIFPAVPFSVSVPPLRIARKSKLNPPAKFGPQDLRRIFVLPDEAEKITDLRIEQKQGEEALHSTRVGPGIFLSWGSQVEADERDASAGGKTKNRSWLAAPIFPVDDIPEQAVIEDPDTHEQINIRHIVRNNRSHNYFYLAPYPADVSGREWYVDFRKIQNMGMAFFTGSREKRIATLGEQSLNLLFSRLMWFFTRAEYFFRSLSCSQCGSSVPVDVRFEGQNFDAEPWE
jgi:hypothetical protein